MKNKKTTLLKSVLALLLCISMLVGSTFAWFTDSVQSGINVIAAGNLDVALYHSNAAVQNEPVGEATKLFMDLKGQPILWEPGVVSYENLRIANEGDLALTYQLAIATANENYIVDGNNQYGLSQILKVGFVEGGITATDRAGVVASVPAANWTTLASFVKDGSLLPAGAGESEKTWGVVVYWEPGDNDNRWNLNNGKTLNQGEVLSIDLGVQLIATQEVNELDGFDNKYDENAKAEFFPGFQGGSAGAAVTADDQGVTTAEVAMDGGDVSAVIPAGVQVAEGTTSMALSVTLKDSSEANVQLGESEEKRALDVHIEGVAQGNTVPMLITLEHYLSTGINTGALRLYHVENGTPVAMTQVAAPANHNEFSYDPATGNVTLALASFSEVAVVADANNPWDGKTRNYLWYTNAVAPVDGESVTEYTIYNADQLAGLADIVDGKAEGIAQDSFYRKTVKLANNITLSGQLFDPIGWGYVNEAHNRKDADGKPMAGKVFQGTFDGGKYEDGKLICCTIFDLHQSGWDLEEKTDTDYTYTNCGFGLFAAASNATFKNLVISGAYVRVECVEAGVLVGLSQNSCTYNNIKILDSKIANYQRPAGGLIGEVSGEGTTTITNVTIGDDVVVGSLWGDFDAPCGGVIGARWDDAGKNPQIVMTNVDVGARMDVYNDITSAYQWHAYRRAGMLIGNTEQTAENNQHLAAARFLTCENVKVYYGDWVNYTYCQFTNHNSSYPWVRTQVGENCEAFSNPRWGVPNDKNGNRVTDMNHVHQEGDECNVLRQFSQLYGGGQGVYGQDGHTGVTVVDSYYSITYVNDNKVLDIIYVTDNTKAYPVGSDQAQKLVVEWAKENIGEGNFSFNNNWMNAGSTKKTEIEAGNDKNIVLYPYFNKPYTARFVDQQGNVIAWCFFHKEDTEKLDATKAAAEAALPNSGEGLTFDYWQVQITDESGKVTSTPTYNKDSFAGYTKDVTIYPVYKYEGDVKLIPVDTDSDGIINYYQVAGYGAETGAQELVEIPSSVNGVYVTEINADAFGSYDDLHSVRIPATVVKINSAVFADDDKSWGQLQRETITIYFEGTQEQWAQYMKEVYTNKNYTHFASDWDYALGEGTCVFFMVDGKVDLSQGYWELADTSKWYQSAKFEWLYHAHPYNSNSGCSNEHNNSTNYSGNCDCDSCDGKTRPDAQYWN